MGSAEAWVFTTKDVIWIVMTIGAGLSAYYALKQELGKLRGKVDKVCSDLDSLEHDLMAKETTIYNRMEILKEDQKAAHEKLDLKMDNLTTHMTQLSTNIAELTGYIKAKREEDGKRA